MKIISTEDVVKIVDRHGLDAVMLDLIFQLKQDFVNWDMHTKMPRPAMHVENGVLELMPICDDQYYSFKYVNCHPKNTMQNKMTVVATGQLSRVDTGYPVMFSEMTILTALRTAATSAIATDLMANTDSKTMAIIGTGAQSEFQFLAAKMVRDIKEVRFFDTDAKAMAKFSNNMQQQDVKLVSCKSAEDAVRGADIVTVCTACKQHVDVIDASWVKAGAHINALGGDTVGKTELDLSLLKSSRVVVEYLQQTAVEGEIQRLSKSEVNKFVVGHLHELIRGEKSARQSSEDITIFDSVGIALEDFSILKMIHKLSEKYCLGMTLDVVPKLDNSKNLMSLFSKINKNV